MSSKGLGLFPASTGDYRALAEKRLPRALFDYIDGGACEEKTLAANVADFQNIMFKQRVMRDVSTINTKTTFFGNAYELPMVLAPIGLAGLMARRAEVQAVRVAEATGIPFCLSTVSICSLEEVAKAATKPFWYQLYMMRDRGYVEQLLQRAENVGCDTLVFTVDLAVVGPRYRDVRNGMTAEGTPLIKIRKLMNLLSHPQWLHDVGIKGKPHVFGNLSEFVPGAQKLEAFKSWVDSQFDASVTWKDIEWLRGKWKGKLIIKGILEPEDALEAVEVGADGVVVSNHGGRQLDGVQSGISMLPHIVEAIGDKAEILVDGGVRSGQDIAKARALGASNVMVGRPWVWALASQGEAGLQQLLTTIKAELNITLALTGCPDINELSPAILDKSQR
ncbi:MAG: L-lactate dehydrogenase [Rhodospirillales bacterium]|nr:L-lactate dehydrogenase [Rhodospirillales bacterium]